MIITRRLLKRLQTISSGAARNWKEKGNMRQLLKHKECSANVKPNRVNFGFMQQPSISLSET